MNRVKDKVIVVTGGSRGIGKSACIELAREGAIVAVTDVLDNEGREVRDEIVREKNKALYWHLDVSNESNVKKVFKDIYKEYGRIDVLVNNAGISGVNKPVDEISLDEWKRKYY